MSSSGSKVAVILVEASSTPSGDVVFVSTDAAGSPSNFKSGVLGQLGLSESSIPKPAALADGFAIISRPSGGLLCFIVTVSDQETESALQQNLLACLRALGQLHGQKLWLPLMGTRDGGLTHEASLRATLNAVHKSGLIFDDELHITIAAPEGTSRSDLKQLRDIAQTFIADEPSTAGVRDSADMQDDRPTDADMLGRTEFAAALARRINRMIGWGQPSDRTSLMIQLHAPWGAGKTSFMRLLEARLKKTPQSRWTILWFNAWENQRIEPPWWMLYDKLFSTLTSGSQVDIPLRIRISIRIKEMIWRLCVGNWANLFLIGSGVTLLGLAAFIDLHANPDASHTVSDYAKGAAAIIGLLSTLGGIVRTAFSNLLGGGSKAAQGFVEIAQDPITKLRRHYEHLLADSNRQIMIFIDDLDRCVFPYVVKLLEGIQTMFAHPSVVWLVASDRRWLTEAFEANYGSVKNVAEPGNRLGYQFLEKAFQLMVALPQIGENEKDRYWRSILGNSVSVEAGNEPLVKEAASLKAAEEELAGGKTEGEVLQVIQENADLSPQNRNRLRRLAVARMAADDIDRNVEHSLSPFSRVLKPNPRAMKRLLNSYTVFRDLALLGNILNTWEVGQRRELARWAILCMDSPVLLDILEQRPALLETSRGLLPEPMEDIALKSLWLQQRTQDLLYGFSNEFINLGPLRPEVVQQFAPLRG
jgi:hypothetical protein